MCMTDAQMTSCILTRIHMCTVATIETMFLKQSHAGHRPVHVWILEIAFVCVSVCVCVCVCTPGEH